MGKETHCIVTKPLTTLVSLDILRCKSTEYGDMGDVGEYTKHGRNRIREQRHMISGAGRIRTSRIIVYFQRDGVSLCPPGMLSQVKQQKGDCVSC